MAKSIFGLLLRNGTDAEFRAWGSALSAKIGSILTRVPQTGDINWSTVTKPAASAMAGSEVFAFNDSLQSSKPIFVKLEYGTGGASSLYHIRATVGKTANGSGVVGGTLLETTSIFQQSSAPTPESAESCYISGGASWFALSLAPVNNLRGGYFAIERSTGAGDALHIAVQPSATAQQVHRFIDYANLTTETVNTGIVAIPLDLSTDRSVANGTTAPVFPAACISPNGTYWRPRVILGTARQNAGLGEVITGLIDGNSYLSLGAGSTRADQRNSVYATTLIRWD